MLKRKENRMNSNYLSQAANIELPTAVQAMINRSCLIDFGVIKKVLAKGVVSVSMSVATSKADSRYITCTLVNISSQTFTLDIEPQVGDKVIVLYPRKFHPDMFDTDKSDVIIDEYARGYNMLSGLAILYNQYQKKFGQNKTVFDINKDGELSYASNENVSLNINKDGELNYSSNDNASFSIDKSGAVNINSNNVNISVDKNGNIDVVGKGEIHIDTSGNVTIDAKGGKLKLKNNLASLQSILDGMLQTLNSSLMTAGSPASHTVVPGQFTAQVTQLSQLMS